MEYDTKYDLARRLISDILSQHEILLSINSRGGSISETRIEKGLMELHFVRMLYVLLIIRLIPMLV
jgi:hypothetical protein